MLAATVTQTDEDMTHNIDVEVIRGNYEVVSRCRRRERFGIFLGVEAIKHSASDIISFHQMDQTTPI